MPVVLSESQTTNVVSSNVMPVNQLPVDIPSFIFLQVSVHIWIFLRKKKSDRGKHGLVLYAYQEPEALALWTPQFAGVGTLPDSVDA
jgi:hypothetical protein